jgi:hypothetical protein
MAPLYQLRPDLKSSLEADELGRIFAEFSQRVDQEMRQPSPDRARGLLIDIFRLDGGCGHGMGSQPVCNVERMAVKNKCGG